MDISEAYAKTAREHGFDTDEDQRRLVTRLGKLQRDVVAYEENSGNWQSRLPWSRSKAAPRGLYIWGGVGRGKTLLMDLFYRTLSIRRKKRIHFHRMMSEVHARLKQLDTAEDPLRIVAADIGKETRLLCFDEFFVSDIADAMILGRLLDGLFAQGVVLVATSNVPPDELYRDGLQRQQFLPAIDALKTHTEIIEMGGDTDYRLRLFESAGTFLSPAGADATARLQHYFDEIAAGSVDEGVSIDILGRDIATVRHAKGVAWFDFTEICDGPRSQEDYIEIARWYPTVIVSDIPKLGRDTEDAARRFIAMVDEFYDRRVKLVVSADEPPASMYQGKRLAFEFRRTSSRLTEMQSTDYLHAPHLS